MKTSAVTRRQNSLLGAIMAATLLGVAISPCVQAQNATVYWDGNGTASGFQLVNGDFGTSTFWNPNNNGIGTLATWVTGNDAAFTYNGTNSLTINSAATARDFLMANQNTNGISVTLNLSGSSTLSVTRNFGVGWSTNGNASTATAVLNQSGGTISGATLNVGRNGANGTWTLSGGSANGTSLVMATDVFGTTTGSVAPVGTVTISGGNMTLSGAISMGRGVAGAIAQATLNVNSGSLTAGTMNIGVGDFSNSTVNLNGGTLTITNTASPGTSTNKTATFRFNGGTLRSAANNGAFVANLSNAYVDSGGAFIDIDGKTSTISQALLQGTGNGGLTLSSTSAGGNLTLSAANTFAGTTIVSGGILVLGNSLALQNSVLNTTASATGNSTTGLRAGVTTLTFGGLTGNKDLSSVFTTASGGYSGLTALTLNAGTGMTNSYSASITNGASGMALTKTGNGTQILSGTNTFTGNTTVSAGRLELSGANALGSTGNVSVASGATLALTASNTVNNAATVRLGGGTIERGAGVSETFGALVLTANSTLNFGSGSVGSLTFNGTGSIYSSSFKLDVTNFAIGNQLVFTNYGDMTSLVNNSAYFSFSNAFTTSFSSNTFTITAIPEAATSFAAIAALALLIWGALHKKRVRTASSSESVT